MPTPSSIRSLRPADRRDLERLYTDPAVRQYLGGPVPQAEAAARAAALYEPSHGSHVWAICGEAPAKPFCGMVTLDRHHEATDMEVSYLLLPAHQGKGHASRAVKEVLSYAFTVLGLDRVIAETQTCNEASIRLAQRLGMQLERRLVRFGRDQSLFVAQPDGTAVEQARWLIEQLRMQRLDPDPSHECLEQIAKRLQKVAESPAWRAPPFRAASSGEELLYELAISPGDGPSLYLVSDGPTVVSRPHGHETWAIIAGIRGRELNLLYRVLPSGGRVAVVDSQVELGVGDVLVLHRSDVHSTEVVGSDPTFHLHLYGRPLHALPSFRSRCYATATGP